MGNRAVIVLTLGLLAAAAFGQGRQSSVVDQAIAGVSNLPPQKIAANDLIAVSVYDAPELTRTIRVAADGMIRVPMLTDRLKAEGTLPAELETSISAALKAGGILVDPMVTVTILEYMTRTVSVMGAVRKPVTFQAVGRVTLLDALTRAEGLTADAGPELLLTINRDEPKVHRIAVKQLIDAADPAVNAVLHGGEEIRVPEARKIYVVGNVKKPGAFAVRDGGEMTVLRILAMAEGLAPFANKRAYIYRVGSDVAMREEILVPLGKILDRKATDVALTADDVLYVPDSRAVA